MRISSAALVFFISMGLTSCSVEKRADNTDYIVTEKDLIPEGVAFDPATQTIYVSSTYKKKIITIDKNGKITDFIKEGQYDIKSVIGMEVDSRRNCLWAISSEANEVLPLKNPGEKQWRSSVYQFSLADERLINKYELHRDRVFLNDLTVSENGIVYITESVGNAVYRIIPAEDSIELFTALAPYQFINGICFSDKPGKLFVSCVEGILEIDLNIKKYTLLPAVHKTNAGTADGLAFHRNYFIAHQSSKVSRFYLSENRDSIVRSDTLDSGSGFDASTTGEVQGDYYYYIVNSQIQSGVDYEKRTVKPIDSLENIIIRKIKL